MTTTQPGRPTPHITLLYDGDCPLCSREIRMLRRLDRGRGRLAFKDISAPDFDSGAYGLSAAAVDARMHGLLPDGTVVTGLEAFRRAYAAVGWGWLLAPTAWPGLRRVCDAAYEWFARNRRRLTGRGGACDTDRCAVPGDGRTT